MQGFSKHYIKRNKQIDHKYASEYDRQVQYNAKKNTAMEAKAYQQFANQGQALSFIKRTYSLVAIGFISNALFYPISVKIVKKLFGLKTFFNIHFAIVPIMANLNAVVLGATQGYYNYLQMKKNYQFA